MNTRVPVQLALMAALLFGSARIAFAQDEKAEIRSPISLTFEQICMAPRSQAPVLIGLTLDPHTQQLMEGTLELQFYDHGTKVVEVHLPDVFLSGNRYETTLVLPPLPAVYNKGLDVNAIFATEKNEYLLSDHTAASNEQAATLLVVPSDRRGMTVGLVCKQNQSNRSKNQKFLSQYLSFDTFAKEISFIGGNNMEFKAPTGGYATTAWLVQADRLPANPLALCAFNVLALSDGGLASLSSQQMVAFKQWVAAGGSLCVALDGEMERVHTQFLSELLSEMETPPALALNPNGELVSMEPDDVIQASLGLGRVVLFGPSADLADEHLTDVTALVKAQDEFADGTRVKLRREGLNDLQIKGALNRAIGNWRRGPGRGLAAAAAKQRGKLQSAAGFLWHVRKDQLRKAEWALPSIRAGGDFEGNGSTAPDSGSGDPLVKQLMPAGVEMVPISLVAGMLLSYIFIVGPGDYLLLGMLKMRRYTWIVFPLVTAIFTIALVVISNQYMATTETGGRIQIFDIAGDRVVRQHEIKLEFYSARRETRLDLGNELFVPVKLKQDAMDRGAIGSPGSRRRREGGREEDDNLIYTGRIGGTYTTTRTLRKWSPRLNRSMSIVSTDVPDCGIDWGNPGDFATTQGRLAIGEAVRRWNPRAGVALINSGRPYILRPMPELPRARPVGYSGQPVDNTYFGFLIAMSQRTRGQGFFGFVSRLAPNGGASMEDIAMVDGSNPREWLLVISWLEGSTQRAYRKLYFQEPATGLGNKKEVPR